MFAVNGRTAWHQDGPSGEPGPIAPDIAEMWALDLWLNSVGFLKAAALPGANPIAAWRWEIGEAGRDGPVTTPEKVTVVSIGVMGKYRVDATINARNLIQRLHTRVAHPVLGDLNVEQEFTDDAYADLGQGMRFPTTWHSHQGYDDNYNTQTISSGHTPRTVSPDLLSIMPPTKLTEGYTFELVSQNHTLTDGRRIVRISYVQPLEHADGMLMVTLPAERLVIRSTG